MPRKNASVSESEDLAAAGRDREVGLADRAAVHRRVAGQVDDRREPQGAGEVRDAHHHPVGEHVARGHAAVRPGHRQEVVAGEQLRARHHYQQQPEREHRAAEHAPRGEAQVRVAHHDDVIQGSQADEAAGEDAEHRELQERHARLEQADVLHALRDLARRVGVERRQDAHALIMPAASRGSRAGR
jgi:hypothetical protein